MPKGEKTDGMFSRLREQAEEIIKQRSEDSLVSPQSDIMELIHELNIHQVELEVQNEELKRAHTEISLLHKEYTDLYEFAPCGYITLNSQMLITRCNLTGVTLLGEDKAKLTGRGLNRFIAPKNQGEYYEVLKKSDKSKDKQSAELIMIRADGEQRWVHADIQADHDETGVLCQWRLVLADITDRIHLENKLAQAQKMESIGTLAGGIAHDFNNILFPLIGFAEMLREDLPKDSPQQENITEVLHAALRAKDLVKQILAFSRKSHQELKPVRLQSILKEVLKLLKSSIPATIDIQTDINSECGLVVADPTQMSQVIMNLATNAYHAMQESGGQLHVSLKQTVIESTQSGELKLLPGNYALLKITDTGTGIKQEIMDKIFDPYFTTKEIGKGTGLGLSVVLGIVKVCHGNIHVYSELGKGTEVHVYLPIMKKLSEIDRSDPSEPIQGGTERILLVDDEEIIVKMEKQILERMGYHVTARIGSVEAFEAFKANPGKFDLIVSDMTMPNMTGVQLANKIKTIRTDIPFIICTGYSDQINEKTSKDLGIQGYVMKPVIKNEIAKTIREVLDKT